MDKLRLIAGYTVLGAWLISLAVSTVNPEYHPDPTLNIVMVALATMLFGSKLLDRGKGDE